MERTRFCTSSLFEPAWFGAEKAGRPIHHRSLEARHQLTAHYSSDELKVLFLLLMGVTAGAWAPTNDTPLPENTGTLEQIRQRAIEELASAPNYVCVDSIERSLWISGERRFRRLDRVHIELAHIEGADRYSWLGDSKFELRSPTEMVGYGASFGGDFADNRALVFKNDSTVISFASQVTIEGRPALRYEYEVHCGGLAVRKGNLWFRRNAGSILRRSSNSGPVANRYRRL
jgi:hypothetical protein